MPVRCLSAVPTGQADTQAGGVTCPPRVGGPIYLNTANGLICL